MHLYIRARPFSSFRHCITPLGVCSHWSQQVFAACKFLHPLSPPLPLPLTSPNHPVFVKIIKRTHTHVAAAVSLLAFSSSTIYIYIFAYVCVCVCALREWKGPHTPTTTERALIAVINHRVCAARTRREAAASTHRFTEQPPP